ncbi:isopentenyl transferase [Nocardia cyriacigeorgica]|uniref:isopentenyl transferase family protein n=1 Tax=Nocardia cyriacigeorgica TaxID=135487 RepID=UPI001894AFE7|nr:isopentenyl transferase family protein [Nocardia cyriacigeorgica]MBF6317481.1 isopentenyl transferase [Nocardia cyriacigeorgica]MBF6531967.1 isopentenyl transferase [Nocardia cyriacigeorgica]
MHIHTIIGPTGIGKSARASAEAHRLGAPIIVADRIQCYVDLATTSARDTGAENADLARHFLEERTVGDGDYAPATAHLALRRTLRALSSEHRCVIVEGGSVSLLNVFFAGRDDLPYTMSTELLQVTDQRAHLDRLRHRAHRMLAPPAGRTGLLQELASAWRHTSQREFIASVVGFGSTIPWCLHHGIPIESLHDFIPNAAQQSELATAIADEHAAYGRLQHQAFLTMQPPPRLGAVGGRIELEERL